MSRTAVCACGRLTVTVRNEPLVVAACHCDFCQKRTGSVFAVGAYFVPDEPLEIRGDSKVYNGLELDGVGNAAGNPVSYHFCPSCGSTLFWITGGDNPILAMAVGNFVDPEFPGPVMEMHGDRRHHWVPVVPGAAQIDPSPS